MNHISLFTGIGGIDLAAEWAGFKTVLMVENDAYCQKVLNKHWPDVPIIGDIYDFKAEKYKGTITLISGGFPCQDVSVAGRGRGLEGNRSILWAEYYRVICEVEPRWVLVENVWGLLSNDDGRFFGEVLKNLASNGYDAEWVVLSASMFGFPHERKRVFLLAYPPGIRRNIPHDSQKLISQRNCVSDRVESGYRWWCEDGGHSLERVGWTVEPTVCGSHDGIPTELDKQRITALGNAVVPQQIYPILKAIADIERDYD